MTADKTGNGAVAVTFDPSTDSCAGEATPTAPNPIVAATPDFTG
jgi:hypothetical protein